MTLLRLKDQIARKISALLPLHKKKKNQIVQPYRDYDTLLFVSLDVITCQYMKKLHQSFMEARLLHCVDKP